MDVLKNIVNGVKSGWAGLSNPKRATLVSVLFFTLVIGMGVTYYAQKVDYTVLFSGLEEQDAGTIVQDLEAQKIDFRLEDAGSTILIDKKQVDRYRIQLAVNDMLPKSSTGFEIFDETSMMATDEDRQIMYQRALQGELERSIQALDGVESAKVLLSIPEEEIFASPGSQPEASASVLLVTRNGRTLSLASVQGIASLLAGAVENLPKQNIEIVDSNGMVLSASFQDDADLFGSQLALQQHEIKRSYEQSLEQKVKEALLPIYGANNLTISVNVNMNFDAQETEAIEYGEEHTRSESVTASGSAGDVAGLTQNDNNTVAVVGGGAEENQTSYSNTKNNELDSITTRTVKAPGEVTDISASLIYRAGMPGPEARELQRLVANIIGAANDNVQVTAANFTGGNTDFGLEAEEGLSAPENFIKKYGMYILAGGAVLLVALITGSVLLSRRNRRRYEEEEAQIEQDESDLQAQKEQELKKLQAMMQSEQVQKEESAHQYAKANPDVVADLIKMWTKDE